MGQRETDENINRSLNFPAERSICLPAATAVPSVGYERSKIAERGGFMIVSSRSYVAFRPIVDAPIGLHASCRRLPQTLLVAEPSAGGVPASDPDRLIKCFIGVVVMGVGANLLTGLVVTQRWAWLPPAVFVAALLVAVSGTGLLRVERYSTPQARAMALLALTGYLAVTVWGSATGWPLAVMILSLAYLWEAGVMLMWSTLRSRAHLDHVAIGTACLLVGSAFLLLGIANPPAAWTLNMVPGLLVRVAFLLLGVGALLLAGAFLLGRWPLMGVPFLLFGVATLLGGVGALLDGWTLVGVALLLAPVTALLVGVAFLLDRSTLLGVPFLMAAVIAPLSGIAAFLAGWTLMGVALLLFGVAFLLGGVAALQDRWTLIGAPFLLLGIAASLSGVAALLAGWTLVGGAVLLLGVAALLCGVALLYSPELPRRLVAWLTKPDNLPLTVGSTGYGFVAGDRQELGSDWSEQETEPVRVDDFALVRRPVKIIV
jgi:hypothetical protein